MKKHLLPIILLVMIATVLVLPDNLSEIKFRLAQIINFGPRDHKNIALTFDADMTPGMLAHLKTGVVKTMSPKKAV